jgi:hypothetical protein
VRVSSTFCEGIEGIVKCAGVGGGGVAARVKRWGGEGGSCSMGLLTVASVQ